MSVLSHFLLWRIGLRPPTTQTTDAERACLARHARGRRNLVEIGVWHGVTTCLLRGAMAPDGVLTAVDPYPPGRLGISFQQIIAHAETRRQPNGTLRWVRSTGAAAARRHRAEQLDEVDFIFIDGDHSFDGLREDWEGWSDLVRTGGALALHDTRSSPIRDLSEAGSLQYMEQVIVHDERYRIVDAVDSLTVLARI